MRKDIVALFKGFESDVNNAGVINSCTLVDCDIYSSEFCNSVYVKPYFMITQNVTAEDFDYFRKTLISFAEIALPRLFTNVSRIYLEAHAYNDGFLDKIINHLITTAVESRRYLSLDNTDRTVGYTYDPTKNKPIKERYDMLEIKVKFFDKELYADGLQKIGGDKSDWIDLRAGADVKLAKGEFFLMPLGVAMQLPDGYEAHLVPRSSTFKKWGVIQTNHKGVIDNSYCGDNDEWLMPIYALFDTEIKKGDRICQFRIMEKQPNIYFEVVDKLNNEDRGGFGSTGTK